MLSIFSVCLSPSLIKAPLPKALSTCFNANSIAFCFSLCSYYSILSLSCQVQNQFFWFFYLPFCSISFIAFFSFVVVLFSCLPSTSFLLYTISPTLSITFNKKILFFYILHYTIILLLLLFTIALYNYYLYIMLLYYLHYPDPVAISCYNIYIYIIIY